MRTTMMSRIRLETPIRISNKRVRKLGIRRAIETIKFAKDASNGLSCEKMLYHLDKTHPRVSAKDKKSKLFCD